MILGFLTQASLSENESKYKLISNKKIYSRIYTRRIRIIEYAKNGDGIDAHLFLK
jgi:hypothetical protein